MTICGARRSGLVVLSAESAERSTRHPCQSLDVTWLLCHPDLSGSRIDDLYLPLRVTSSQLSPGDKVCRLRLGQLLALGRVDFPGQSAMPVPISAQLLPSRLAVLE